MALKEGKDDVKAASVERSSSLMIVSIKRLPHFSSRWGRKVDFNAIMNGAQGMSGAKGNASSAKGVKPGDVDFTALFEALKKEACKTPEERAREGVLKKHDLSEVDYQRLPKDQRAGIDMEIAAAVRRVTEQRRASMAARNGAAA